MFRPSGTGRSGPIPASRKVSSSATLKALTAASTVGPIGPPAGSGGASFQASQSASSVNVPNSRSGRAAPVGRSRFRLIQATEVLCSTAGVTLWSSSARRGASADADQLSRRGEMTRSRPRPEGKVLRGRSSLPRHARDTGSRRIGRPTMGGGWRQRCLWRAKRTYLALWDMYHTPLHYDILLPHEPYHS